MEHIINLYENQKLNNVIIDINNENVLIPLIDKFLYLYNAHPKISEFRIAFFEKNKHYIVKLENYYKGIDSNVSIVIKYVHPDNCTQYVLCICDIVNKTITHTCTYNQKCSDVIISQYAVYVTEQINNEHVIKNIMTLIIMIIMMKVLNQL